jgi:hypothetical protein
LVNSSFRVSVKVSIKVLVGARVIYKFTHGGLL